jgi:hypothetical protein
MSDAETTQNAAPSPGSPDEAKASTLLAKWLIPSAAVLFAAIGYVAQSAQASLLGVESAERESTAYFNSAADFVRDGVIRLLSWPLSEFQTPRLYRPVLMTSAIVAVAVAVWVAHSRFGANRRRVTLAALAIVGVVAFKFVLMDAPLLKIQDLVSSREDSCWALVARADRPRASCAEIMAAAWPESVMWNQASEIAGELVCSRVTARAAAQLPYDISHSRACSRDMDQNKVALSDEFLSNLFLEFLTILGALVVLRRATHNTPATASCLLVLFYGLTAPYAYGKIGMTQLFDYGDARISEALQKSYRDESPYILSDKGWLPGVILHKDDKGASILTIRADLCQGANPVTMKQRASLSYVAGSQLMSFDEINRLDVITWLATQQRACPGT